MRQATDGVRPNPAEETIVFQGLSVRFLLTADDTSGSVATFELIVPPTGRLPVPSHSHDHFEETIYGVEGVLAWTVGGRQMDVLPGQALCIPRGAVHRFDNLGSRDAKALCIITPGALGPDYFREIAAILAEATSGPPDKVRLVEAMLRHGLKPAA